MPDHNGTNGSNGHHANGNGVADPEAPPDPVTVEICERLIAGEGANKICDGKDGRPTERQFYNRMASDTAFRSCIARAREIQQDALIAQTVEMADAATEETVNVVKLRIWARQWQASRLAPKKYGDHSSTDVNVGGTGKSIVIEIDPNRNHRRMMEAERAPLELNGANGHTNGDHE